MKTYLGSKMTIFMTIGTVFVFLIFPITLAVIILSTGISIQSVAVAIFCVLAEIVGAIFVKKVSAQLFSWGEFDEKGIVVKTGLKRYVIEYEKCNDIGIGLYVHGYQSKTVGIKVYYIFFTYEPFDEEYRLRMNFWQPSDTRIKIEFSEKLYNYLLTALPRHHAIVLKHDYETMK